MAIRLTFRTLPPLGALPGLVLGLVLSLAPSAFAQDLGRGSAGFAGVRPKLEVRTLPGAQSFSFVASELAQPGAQGGAFFFLVSPLPGELPLGVLGVPEAVLGVDLGTMVLLGPFPLDAQGQATLQAPLPAAWRGVALFVQGMQIDPRLPGQLAFSDSRSLVLGQPGPELVLTQDGTLPGLVRLARFAPSGAAGTPVHDLVGLRLLDLRMASIDEERAFRPDLPRPIEVDGARALRLPDGSTVLHYEKPAAVRRGFARVFTSGRIVRIIEAPAAELLPVVAASETHLAFVSGAVPRLYVLRLDERGWPGQASPLLDATPAAGLRLEPDALCFGKRVLAYADRNQGMWLISLTSGQAQKVVMPKVGGAPPAAFDEEIAVSGNGRVFALGAGPTRKLKDILVVRDDGTALNVSNKVSDYAEVGYMNPGRRTDIALNQDGSKVSYVDEGGAEPEGFVSAVVVPQPSHITTSTTFVDSIDIGSTSRMPPQGGGLVFAGLDNASLDLFFTAGLTDKDIVPLTKTAPATTRPFAKDAKLTLLDLASVDGVHPYLLQATHSTRGPLVYVVDSVRRTAREALQSALLLRASLGPGGELLLGDAQGFVRLDTMDPAASYVERLKGPVGSPRQLSVLSDGSAAALIVRTTQGDELWHASFTASSSSAQRLGQASSFGDVYLGHGGKSLHALSAPQSSSGRQLLLWDGPRGLVPLGGQQLRAFVQD